MNGESYIGKIKWPAHEIREMESQISEMKQVMGALGEFKSKSSLKKVELIELLRKLDVDSPGNFGFAGLLLRLVVEIS